jgi:CopG family nickel-responsive transcriptional regulator
LENIIRFGVSIEPNLLQKFDKHICQKGYTNRSEAIRDMIRKNLITQQQHDPNAEAVGTLTMIYDHHTGNLTNTLLDLQHDHHHTILTTTHVHIDNNNCLEVLVLKGKIKDIQFLADTIKSIKGIKHGELVTTTSLL